MANIGRGGGARRPPIAKKVAIMRLTRYGLIAQAWPRPRGKPKDRYQRDILQRMKDLQHAIRFMHPREVDPMAQALARWNRKNRGQMGSATIRLRDLMTAHLSGRFLAFLLPDGQWQVHVDALQDYSRRLDWIEPQVGSILTRTPLGWRPTTPCEPGAVLQVGLSTPLPGCCAPATYHPGDV